MIKNIVISGGGFKTLPVLGALEYLEDRGLLKNVEHYSATSAGTVYSLMLILGYNVEQIKDLLLNFDFSKIIKPTIDLDNFLQNYYIYSTDGIEALLKLIINYKLKDDNRDYSSITMLELYNLTKKKFTCTTVSLKERTVIYNSYLNNPDLPVYKAVLMSCTLPMIFKPCEWNNDKFLDGGIIDNLPFCTIPIEEQNETLSICTTIKFLDSKVKFDSIFEYFTHLLSIISSNRLKPPEIRVIYMEMEEQYANQVINLDISMDEKIRLIKKGYVSASEQYKNILFKPKKINRSNSF